MRTPPSRPHPRWDETGADDLAISVDLLEPFFGLTCKFFESCPQYGSDRRVTYRYLRQVYELCCVHDNERESNSFALSLRMRALVAMRETGAMQSTHPQLWRLNANNATVPSARLIRAVLTVTWPPLDEVSYDPDDLEPLRQAWALLVDHCVALALGPSCADALIDPISSYLN